MTSINDAPVGTSGTVTALEDVPFIITAAAFGFTDPLDIPANFFNRVDLVTLPGLGTLKLNGVAVTTVPTTVTKTDLDTNKLTYTSALNGNGLGYASFTFKVGDDGGTTNGGVSLDLVARTLTVNVTAVSDEPVGVSDAYIINLSKTLPFTVAAPGVLANDSDPDTISTWSLSVHTQPANGLIVLNPNGSFTYTQTGSPPLDYIDTFTYRITDSGWPTPVDVTVNLTVDLQRPTMAEWVLPVTQNLHYTPTLGGAVDLVVRLPDSSDVTGVEFAWYELGGGNLGIVPVSYVNGGFKYFVVNVPNSIFPKGEFQLFAWSWDDAGNRFNLTNGIPSTYPRIFVNQNYSYVFLPLIMR